MSQNSFERTEGSPNLPLRSTVAVLPVLPSPMVSPHLLAHTKSRINLFRLYERIDRGPAISSVCHRRSLGLLNPYLSVFSVPMIPSVALHKKSGQKSDVAVNKNFLDSF